MQESIEIYRLEFILEDFYNLFLAEPNKLKGEVWNFQENFILWIFIIPTGL